jgi:hypothetical protein
MVTMYLVRRGATAAYERAWIEASPMSIFSTTPFTWVSTVRMARGRYATRPAPMHGSPNASQPSASKLGRHLDPSRPSLKIGFEVPKHLL